jgi:hypothetical protein
LAIRGGYYIKARRIQESAIADAPPHVREIWDWLIMKANHAPRRSSGRMIERGQVKTSYSEIMEGLSWKVGYRKMRYSKANCETAMKVLTRTAMVTTAKTTRGLIITLCNYDHYQDPKNYENRTETDNENITRTTVSRHGKQEEEELEEKKKEKIPLKKGSDKHIEKLFEERWTKYPKKDGRKIAFRHFKATIKSSKDVKRFDKALGNYLKDLKSKGTDRQFVKNGSTWFFNWEDWVDWEHGEEAGSSAPVHEFAKEKK